LAFGKLAQLGVVSGPTLGILQCVVGGHDAVHVRPVLVLGFILSAVRVITLQLGHIGGADLIEAGSPGDPKHPVVILVGWHSRPAQFDEPLAGRPPETPGISTEIALTIL
jgi:hypothetical protein